MMASIRIFAFACVILVIAAGVNLMAFAQDEAGAISQETSADAITGPSSSEDAATELVNEQQVQKTFEATKPPFNPQAYNSLLFTTWEMENIERMRRIASSTDSGMTRVPVDALEGQEFDAMEKVKPPPEEREIRLSGILYNAKDSWTIWLNEKRVTPDALPREVIDLKVYKEYIEFKWFDDYTNRIYPVRLRPHQRFNIDTRIFLPG